MTDSDSRDRTNDTSASPRGVSRRQALGIGAVAAGSLTLGLDRTAAAAEEFPRGRRREQSFDDDWRFFRGDVSGGEAPSFDDSAWRVLDLPHDWSIEDLPYAPAPDGAITSDPSLLVPQTPPTTPVPPPVIGPFDPQNSANDGSIADTVGGIAWYRKEFRLAPAGDHVELRFDGVYQNADIWLNGTHLGFHPYGYTPFSFDLTSLLNDSGTNVLAVRVDNSGKTSRWYSGSGIYRHTWLTVTGPIRIPLFGVAVTTPTVDERRSVARVDVSVTNLGTRPAAATARVTVFDPRGRVVAERESDAGSVAPGATVVPSLDVAIDHAALWSPDAPNLYTARADIAVGDHVVDSVSTTFGIRSLVWHGDVGFLLNGNPIKIDGGCIHSDHGPMGAVSLAHSEERKIATLKAAGFNAIRTAHNPHAPALLDACDRMGMLVWDEFVDMWDTGKNPQDYSLFFADWWQRDLTSMILRDRNHPSVVLWSLGNEITDNTHGQRGTELADLVRSLDTTRPISLGGGSTFGASDPSWGYVDVGDVHYNANGQGYAAIHAAHPDRAMTQSESFPVTIFQDAAFVHDNVWAVGNWVWAAWDYLGEAGIGKTPIPPVGTGATFGDQDVMPGWSIARVLHHSWAGFGYPYPYFEANCGDLDLIGQRKPQNHWRAVVSGRSQVELLVLRPAPEGLEQVAVWWGYYDELTSWTWDVAPQTPMIVHVYTLGDTVTLFLNGSQVATTTVTADDRALATLTVPYSPGELTAVASRNGVEIGRTTLATVGTPFALRLVPDVERLTTSRDDLAYVLVEVVDSEGKLVPDAVADVMFQVGGAGELAAVGNGNAHNVDSFRQPRRFTWHGRALAILRPAKRPGTLTLVASTPGLHAARVALRVDDDR